MTAQLYDVPDNLQPFLDVLEEADDEALLGPALSEIEHELHDGLADVTPEQRVAIQAQLLTMGMVVKNLEADKDTITRHLQETQGKLDATQRRIDFLKSWMLNLMQQTGVDKVKNPLLTVYTQANPMSLDIAEDAKVPDEWKRARLTLPLAELPAELLDQAEVEVNRRDLLDWIKTTGEAFDGVTVVKDRKHVRVR